MPRPPPRLARPVQSYPHTSHTPSGVLHRSPLGFDVVRSRQSGHRCTFARAARAPRDGRGLGRATTGQDGLGALLELLEAVRPDNSVPLRLAEAVLAQAVDAGERRRALVGLAREPAPLLGLGRLRLDDNGQVLGQHQRRRRVGGRAPTGALGGRWVRLAVRIGWRVGLSSRR
eukprot:scaffold39513_cov58-Phaeocystis_antarctica.AAC.1